MFGDHGLCGLLEEGAHEKSPKCLSRNLGDFGEFCKGLVRCMPTSNPVAVAFGGCGFPAGLTELPFQPSMKPSMNRVMAFFMSGLPK